MTRDDVLAAFDRIRVWQQGDRRAVHKPLLVLLALARDTTLVAEIARRILNAHFPESIRDAFASKLAPTAAARCIRERARSHSRCCVCGHDLRMGGHE